MVGKQKVRECIMEACKRQNGNDQRSLVEWFGSVRRSLGRWKRDCSNNSKERLCGLRFDLEAEYSSGVPDWEKIKFLKLEISQAFRDEEEFWRQKSRDKWLVVGDNNTSFVHASVKDARQRNQVSKLVDNSGQEATSAEAMGRVAVEYFTSLFSSGVGGDLSDIFDGFPARVTAEINQKLSREVSDVEIRDAVFGIKSSSAPGWDGLNGLFFQKYWDIIGPDITKEIKAFFSTGSFPREWNVTQLCLIPKVINPERMVDLRPISLCTVMYKIISRIFVSRLKPLLETVVLPTQSAFVPERLISDNIIIAHEVVHGLRTHRSISSEFIAIKTDMSKAYDRIEWRYLEKLLTVMGFEKKFVDWIMFCVTSVTYSVLINGEEKGKIIPQRGLRQGDPLSPFLFDLCTEGLSHLLNKAESMGDIEGIKFSEDGPAIHHLFVADDSLLMVKASDEQCTEIRRILKMYEESSGQMISLAKSSITFGAKIELSRKVKVKEILGIEAEGGTSKYLGLPECFSGSKVEMLQYFQEKMKSRFHGWYGRLLSAGGKDILLKTVAMAMPVFAMLVFKLPKTTCKNLTSAMSKFWWDVQEGKSKIHWIS